MKIDNSDKYCHGLLLERKATSTNDGGLMMALESYNLYRARLQEEFSKTEPDIKNVVTFLNDYRKSAIPILEKRANSGQEGLRSTILEEFMYIIFDNVIDQIFEQRPKNLFLGKSKSFVDLTFAPSKFQDIFDHPIPYIHSKDQDFIVGATFDLSLANGSNIDTQKIVIPAFAIECKTYIEKNMLDSCAGTAKRLKSAMPYCKYLVVAEYMKMETATPELTSIDEVFVLCKATVGERTKSGANIHDIDSKLVGEIVSQAKEHLTDTWWDKETTLSVGKIINRPNK